jgi:hypothetical protein
MIRSGKSAWAANEAFFGDRSDQPGWTYQRYGRTTTILPDGRIVEIGGEHEDYYDPDFCIYNDVTVFHPDGTIDIYAYPEEVFPPTDNHSATYCEDGILIIGNLGYDGHRKPGSTPVYRFDTRSFAIEQIETTGECPGWIHGHKAVLDENGRIVVSGGLIDCGDKLPLQENADEWRLDLSTRHWTHATRLEWKQWHFVRTDRKHNHLWQIRQAIWARDANWKDDFLRDMERLSKALGHEPDLDSIASLYAPDDSDAPPPRMRHDGIVTQLDGVAIRIKENHRAVHAMVEGRLPDGRIKAFQDEVLSRLARLEGTDWEIICAR